MSFRISVHRERDRVDTEDQVDPSRYGIDVETKNRTRDVDYVLIFTVENPKSDFYSQRFSIVTLITFGLGLYIFNLLTLTETF